MTIYNKKKKKSKPKKQLKTNVWDWIHDQANNSISYKNRVLDVAKGNSNDTIGIKPETLYPSNFVRYPKELKLVLLKNSSQFKKIEYILLDYILTLCLSYNTWITWYKLQDILYYCDINKASFYRAWRGLVAKNIIKIHKLSKDEQKLHNIYRTYCILVNPFWDTWTMDITVNEDQSNEDQSNEDQSNEDIDEDIDEDINELLDDL